MPLIAFLMILLLQVICSLNYMTLYYNIDKAITYNNGFSNRYRPTEDIDCIILGNS